MHSKPNPLPATPTLTPADKALGESLADIYSFLLAKRHARLAAQRRAEQAQPDNSIEPSEVRHA